MEWAASQVLPGSQSPLGATPRDGGTNFAVASEDADAVTLCLFDDSGAETRIPLLDRDGDTWHGFMPGVGPGQAYGYRVSGRYDPAGGQRCNQAKLLLDPYARATSGAVRYGPEILDFDVGDPRAPSALDSAGHVPRSVVVDSAFDWLGDAPIRRHSADTISYELHVKGFTMRNPRVPEELRGTYAGLGHEAALDHLVSLGITAVQLMPVCQSVTEQALRQRGLVNYWGYNPVGFFAPHDGYSSQVRCGHAGGQVAEFKSMVRALHSAGLEVILDIAFAHTAEGDQLGPTLCFKGLDNRAYYQLEPGYDSSRYLSTMAGRNSLNIANSSCMALVMNSLRYWIKEMHVDGFRFDLPQMLARNEFGYDRMVAFLDMIAQDPTVSQVKLFAETWDVGQMDSYAVYRFPPFWHERNERYRDEMRDFWRGRTVGLGEFAARFSGSADLYESPIRSRAAALNLITAHDGFTLADLVSYDERHNEANGESGDDGTADNRSWNCGVEGPTDDAAVLALRARQSRAMLATLLLSFGVPLLLGGDELGRTQGGNNNAFCQDSEISWIDWSGVDEDLLAFTRRLAAFRNAHPVFRRRRYLAGVQPDDLLWLTPAGTPMTPDDWSDFHAMSIAMYLDGSHDPDRAPDGSLLIDDDFLVLINAWSQPLAFIVPGIRDGQAWRAEIDTHDPVPASPPEYQAGDPVTVGPRSLVVLRASDATRIRW